MPNNLSPCEADTESPEQAGWPGQTDELSVQVRGPASIYNKVENNQERHPRSTSGFHRHIHTLAHTHVHTHMRTHAHTSNTYTQRDL